MSKGPRLQYFPISFFSTVMGLSGLTIAWQRTETFFNLSFRISTILFGITALVFLLILSFYLMKIFRYPEALRAELYHPVKLNFFPTISISLILLGIIALPLSTGLSLILWAVGTMVQLLFTLYVMSMWVNQQHFKIEHVNPAWFIPIVGNVLVPIGGVPHGYPEISWFYFSFSMLFWLVLLVINFYRFIFHSPVPAKLMPTLFILIAPPSIGFLSYYNLTEQLDAFARILYYSALFFTLFLGVQLLRFTKLHFALTWWAYSFPMAAVTIATLVMYHVLGGVWFHALSLVFVAILSFILIILTVRTLIAIARRKICINEE